MLDTMKSCRATAILFGFAAISSVKAQQVDPRTESEFNCYVQSAEARLRSRQSSLAAAAASALKDRSLREGRIQTSPADAANPRQVTEGLIHDWVGKVYVPNTSLDRVLYLLQDYDRRAQYFKDVLASSKLLCRTEQNRFRVSMRLKEPDVIDTENDITYEQIDRNHWQSRSYSTSVREVGTDHKYLLRLNSYWTFSVVNDGVLVEGEAITLSGQFGSAIRAVGSLFRISPEKSLRRTLASIRETALKPGLEFAIPPSGLPDCGERPVIAGCASAQPR
jgi:hypothetical protein